MDELNLTADERRLAQMFKALGNPVRLAIVKYLADCRRCICGEIVAALPLAQSTVSQHLKVLKEAGLIRGEITGPATCYCMDPEGLSWFIEVVGGHLASFNCRQSTVGDQDPAASAGCQAPSQ